MISWGSLGTRTALGFAGVRRFTEVGRFVFEAFEPIWGWVVGGRMIVGRCLLTGARPERLWHPWTSTWGTFTTRAYGTI